MANIPTRAGSNPSSSRRQRSSQAQHERCAAQPYPWIYAPASTLSHISGSAAVPYVGAELLQGGRTECSTRVFAASRQNPTARNLRVSAGKLATRNLISI